MATYDIKKIGGVIPALVTPFDAHQEIDLKQTKAVVAHLLKQDIGGLYLTGSTGEGLLMTGTERKRFVETVVDEVAGKVPIIVHVGAMSTKLSSELAAHAGDCGADAVSTIPPIYYKFSDDDVVGYYSDITRSTSIPMMIYSISLAGTISFDMIKKLGAVEGVKAIKYTNSTLFDLIRIKEHFGNDFRVYSGSDEMAMAGFLFGADGIIGTFYNCIPEIYIKMEVAFKAGDMKAMQKYQKIANRIIMESIKYDYLSVVKLMMKWLGCEVGQCRSPFHQYNPEEETALKKIFADMKSDPDMLEIEFLNRI